MMLTWCCPRAGPTGGAGFACPAGICSLTFAVIGFFAISPPARRSGDLSSPLPGRLDRLDLHEIQLDRGGRPKIEPSPGPCRDRVDLVDLPDEVAERPVDHLDALADLERDLGRDLALLGHAAARGSG